MTNDDSNDDDDIELRQQTLVHILLVSTQSRHHLVPSSASV